MRLFGLKDWESLLSHTRGSRTGETPSPELSDLTGDTSPLLRTETLLGGTQPALWHENFEDVF